MARISFVQESCIWLSLGLRQIPKRPSNYLGLLLPSQIDSDSDDHVIHHVFFLLRSRVMATTKSPKPSVQVFGRKVRTIEKASVNIILSFVENCHRSCSLHSRQWHDQS